MGGMYDKIEFFRTYFANATEKELLVQRLDKRFIPSKKSLTILDLGSHDGALMKNILTTYAHRLPKNTELSGVDPSAPAIAEFAKRDYGNSVSVKTYVNNGESFLEKNSHKYEWIFASQCLYWTKNLSDIVAKINKASKAALIVLRGKKGIFEIQSSYRDFMDNDEEQLYTADNIQDALDSLALPYQREDLTTYIRLPEVGSQEFRWLIAFFLQTDESKISDDLYAEVENFIIKKSKWEMQHDVSHFWLGEAMVA